MGVQILHLRGDVAIAWAAGCVFGKAEAVVDVGGCGGGMSSAELVGEESGLGGLGLVRALRQRGQGRACAEDSRA